MKLTYRGTDYDYDIPAVDVTEGEVAGKYRGQHWNYHYVRHIPVPQKSHELMYRGVAYTTQGAIQASTGATAKPAETTPAAPVKRCAMITDNVARAHRTNICNILERRVKAAQARGDEKLLRLLELEAEQLAC